MRTALLVIDVQNDYFPDGNFPLWNAEKTLANITNAIARAREHDIEIIHVQHIANPENGASPFFNEGSEGVKIHASILAAAPNAPIIIKRYADAFLKTNLEQVLKERNVSKLLVCGMMTQNCVTHTAISKSADKYQVSILKDCCTTVTEMIHEIALDAVGNHLELIGSLDEF